MVERPVSGSSTGPFLFLVTGSYNHQLSRIFCSPDSTPSQGLQQSATILNFHRKDTNVPAPCPLFRLLSTPDGLAGDAKGPRHCGLGLPAAAQQPDGGGLLGRQSPGTPREPAFLSCPPNADRYPAFDRLQLGLGRPGHHPQDYLTDHLLDLGGVGAKRMEPGFRRSQGSDAHPAPVQ